MAILIIALLAIIWVCLCHIVIIKGNKGSLVSFRKPSLVHIVFVSTDMKSQLVHRLSFAVQRWTVAQ